MDQKALSCFIKWFRMCLLIFAIVGFSSGFVAAQSDHKEIVQVFQDPQ